MLDGKDHVTGCYSILVMSMDKSMEKVFDQHVASPDPRNYQENWEFDRLVNIEWLND